jgi:PAS domain S-box-containing protein
MLDSIRVLIVEDSVDDASLIVRELSRGGFHVISERVQSAGALRTALEAKPWELVISDYAMPGFGGAAALAICQQQAPDTPFIIVSGVMGEHLAVEMLKSGAHNYVMKDQLGRLAPAVRQELRAGQERRVRKESEATAAYVASLVESCEDAIIGTTLNGKIASWNPGAERLFGYCAAEMLGRPASVLVPAYRPEDLSEILQLISEGRRVEPCETAWLGKTRTPVEVLLTVSSVKAANGQIIGASIVAHDITRRKLEENDRLALIQELTAALSHASKATVQASAQG